MTELTTAAALITAAILVRFFFACIVWVDGRSMMTTLHHRDLLLAVRYFGRGPQRGDIVICRYPGRKRKTFPKVKQHFVKRVIGLPGETVAFRDGQVTIDGVPLEEPWLDPRLCRRMRGRRSVTLGEDQYYVLGDNRDHSNDSRSVGPLPRGMIRWRAAALLLRTGRNLTNDGKAR